MKVLWHLGMVFVKSEFHPSDISTITVDENDLETIKNEAFLGFSDVNNSSVVKLKEDAIQINKNTHPKVRFQDGDLSTITEVTEFENTGVVKNQSNLEEKCMFPGKNIKKEQKANHKQTSTFINKETENVKERSLDYMDLWDEVRAKTLKQKNLLDTGFIGRESLNSYVSDATTVEYVYTDPENGITLLERHVPSVCGSVGSRRSLDSQFSLDSRFSLDHNSEASQEVRYSGISEETEIYDWREEAMCEGFGVKNEVDAKKTPTIKPDLKKLDNKTVRYDMCITNTSHTRMRSLSIRGLNKTHLFSLKSSPKKPLRLIHQVRKIQHCTPVLRRPKIG